MGGCYKVAKRGLPGGGLWRGLLLGGVGVCTYLCGGGEEWCVRAHLCAQGAFYLCIRFMTHTVVCNGRGGGGGGGKEGRGEKEGRRVVEMSFVTT